jgi:hypothetical protein
MVLDKENLGLPGLVQNYHLHGPDFKIHQCLEYILGKALIAAKQILMDITIYYSRI